MIKEVIVVEGESDRAAIQRAGLEADVILTEGFNLSPKCLKDIEGAMQHRGIIILTDPDSAGEQIRRFLSVRFPEAKHAFVPKIEATANGDVGIEQASPEAIREALSKARSEEFQPVENFFMSDLIRNELNGSPNSAKRRDLFGRILGLGHTNAKQFLRRLNRYGISKKEFENALKEVDFSERDNKSDYS